ncbi:MAG: hypothetical protein JW982_13660 [Spirochaetes bacterium]|nr:hypothetical protein [Spirochaetota bacterium]
MKSGNNDSKRIERRARIMIMEKDIPPSKMEIVRSLIKNDTLLNDEKYGAVIDLIQNCPEKKIIPEKQGRKIKTDPPGSATKESSANRVQPEAVKPEPVFGPVRASVFINLLASKYRETGFYKKKIILRHHRFPGFVFYKRLVPSRNLYKAMKLIVDSQQKIASRMPFIMDAILNDQEIEDPTVYNYLRVLNVWMNEIPLLAIRYENSVHLRNDDFLNEFSSYIKYFTSFMDVNTEIKERIISVVELKLRLLTLGANEIENRSQEKSGAQSEKIIYDYMMTFRSFLPLNGIPNGLVDKQLEKKYKIQTLSHFILNITESLLFRHETDFNEIRKYFKIQPLSVSTEKWMCSENDLKLAGKDESSRMKKYRENLKVRIEPLDEIYEFTQMKFAGLTLLKKAFDDQWKILNKRRYDYGDFYNENFFVFMDECLSYFTSALMPFIDGTQINFIRPDGTSVNSCLFEKEYFSRDLSMLNDLLSDMASYRADNPTMKITSEEMRKILTGQLSTFNDVRQLMFRIGSLFYNFAEDIHLLYRLHNQWSMLENREDSDNEKPLSRNAVFNNPVTDITEFSPVPRAFPFYSCRIGKGSISLPHIRLFSGKPMWGESINDSLILFFTGFCFQIAFECDEERLHNNLVQRKELKTRLTELIGRI